MTAAAALKTQTQTTHRTRPITTPPAAAVHSTPQVIGFACAVYAKHPHLVQICAPRARRGDLDFPATAYLVDTYDAAAVTDCVDALRPALEDAGIVKATHSARQWAGPLLRQLGVRVAGCFDTQRAHHVLTQLKLEAGKTNAAHVSGAGAGVGALLLAVRREGQKREAKGSTKCTPRAHSPTNTLLPIPPPFARFTLHPH